MDASVRNSVRRRAKDRCEYCRLPQEYATFFRFHIEHIRAVQHGGDDDLANLALACPGCNAHKGPNLTAIDPETDDIVPLFHPRLNSWNEHFLMDDAYIVGLTPQGRATARLLDMNSDDRVAVREELVSRGEF